MNEIVERVARAIATADGCSTASCQKHMMDSYECLARAAIGALQVPTIDMIAAAFPCEANEDFSFEDKQLGAATCLKLGGWEKIGIMNCEPIKQAAFLVRDYRLMMGAALRQTLLPDHQSDKASHENGSSPQNLT